MRLRASAITHGDGTAARKAYPAGASLLGVPDATSSFRDDRLHVTVRKLAGDIPALASEGPAAVSPSRWQPGEPPPSSVHSSPSEKMPIPCHLLVAGLSVWGFQCGLDLMKRVVAEARVRPPELLTGVLLHTWRRELSLAWERVVNGALPRRLAVLGSEKKPFYSVAELGRGFAGFPVLRINFLFPGVIKSSVRRGALGANDVRGPQPGLK